MELLIQQLSQMIFIVLLAIVLIALILFIGVAIIAVVMAIIETIKGGKKNGKGKSTRNISKVSSKR